MTEKSIKVNIAGRVYPLTVHEHEEGAIREAEQKIDQSVLAFQQNYAVKDKQDLLAMAALQIASKQANTQTIEKVVEKIVEVPNNSADELIALEHLVDLYLV
jgi:cell division protein ZapA